MVASRMIRKDRFFLKSLPPGVQRLATQAQNGNCF